MIITMTANIYGELLTCFPYNAVRYGVESRTQEEAEAQNASSL